MSSEVLPSLIGLTWKRKRAPGWDTIIQTAVSGGETRIAQRPQPKWHWEQGYSYLGSGNLNNVSNTDLQTLMGFYNARQGMYDSFLYEEPDDKSVTGQSIGTGDGTTLAYQLTRTLGGFSETILAPNVVSKVYVSGTAVSAANYTVGAWGSATPGVVTFTAGNAPAAAAPVTADFTYYWPVRFDADLYQFSNEMDKIWALDKLGFIQVYN